LESRGKQSRGELEMGDKAIMDLEQKMGRWDCEFTFTSNLLTHAVQKHFKTGKATVKHQQYRNVHIKGKKTSEFCINILADTLH
jgi:hypothetical protein